MKTDCIYRI